MILIILMMIKKIRIYQTMKMEVGDLILIMKIPLMKMMMIQVGRSGELP